MNEKIKEFAKQAWPGLPSHWWDSRDGAEAVEKFAELIVQECSRVIVNGGYWSGGPIGPKRQCTPPEIAQMIQEHFGVEE